MGVFQNSGVVIGLGGVVALGAIVAGFLLVKKAIGPGPRESYDRITRVASEFRALRERGAADTEFDAFQQRAASELTPVVKSLAKDPSDKANAILIRAARDYLMRMIVEARKSPNNSEKLFDEHMQQARQFL